MAHANQERSVRRTQGLRQTGHDPWSVLIAETKVHTRTAGDLALSAARED